MSFARWRKILYSIGLTLGLALFLRQVWIGYLALSTRETVGLQIGYLFAGLVCYLLCYLIQMAAWATIMRYLHAPLTAHQVLEGYLLSFLPRYIPGSVWGYFSRNEWLAQRGVTYSTSTLASVLEVTSLLLTAGSVALVYLATGWLRLTILPLLALALFLNWWAAPQLLNRFGRGRWQVDWQINHFFPYLLLGNALYLLFWVVYGAALLFTMQGIGGGGHLDIATGIFTASLAWTIGFLIIFVPTGLGVREASLVFLLAQYAAIPNWLASSAAVISRLSIIVAELIWLLAGLGLTIKGWRQRRTEASYAKHP